MSFDQINSGITVIFKGIWMSVQDSWIIWKQGFLLTKLEMLVDKIRTYAFCPRKPVGHVSYLSNCVRWLDLTSLFPLMLFFFSECETNLVVVCYNGTIFCAFLILKMSRNLEWYLHILLLCGMSILVLRPKITVA